MEATIVVRHCGYLLLCGGLRSGEVDYLAKTFSFYREVL